MTVPPPVTLITGASGGIGSALAQALNGHALILQGRDAGRLEAQCAGLLDATPLLLDLTRPETFAGALAGLPRLTNIVHNAGVVELGAVDAQDHTVWTHTLAVNVVAPAELTRLLLPHVRQARGSIVFVNSGAGQMAFGGVSSYAASKFALRALADSLRDEEAARGVRVTTVYPGPTDTAMQRKVVDQLGGEYDRSILTRPETVADAIRYVLELPRDATLPELSLRPGPL